MWFWSKTALLVRRDAGVAGRAGCNSSGFLPKELCVPLCRVICDKNIGGDCAAQGASRSVSAALRSLPAMGLPLLAARRPHGCCAPRWCFSGHPSAAGSPAALAVDQAARCRAVWRSAAPAKRCSSRGSVSIDALCLVAP